MLNLKIVTPDGSAYESPDVISVSMPTETGIITVYDDHEPIMSILTPGEISIEKIDHTVELVISSGLLQIQRDSAVYMLVDTVERAEEIDLEAAEEAHRRAEEFLARQEAADDEEFARMQALLQKELARIEFANRKRKV